MDFVDFVDLTHLTDIAGLENFFRDSIKSTNSAPLSNTEPFKKNLVYAWLRLSEEFSQDGFIKFGIAPESIVVTSEKEGWKALGKATVVAKGGDRGEIGVVMIFKADGSLDKISETRSARPGIRPKCQATKVLDPDSVVRAMADQDILIMGSRIEKYLLEQYSSPTQN